MAECSACGAHVSPDEHFCGNCGAQLSPSSPELKTVAAVIGDEIEVQPLKSLQLANTLENADTREAPIPEKEPEKSEPPVAVQQAEAEPKPISSASLGGSFTDSIRIPETNVQGTSATSHQEGTTGGHQPTVKQLPSNTVLNGRYEIVRRIGGGGMGAVYLAKDRNLGDAPRAVKEMVESHLDPTQHEKAIGDFKRESLLLTSLEHSSIPTIYDYFYDEEKGRFYLVMKYISGGDFAARLRNAPGGRVDEKTVADWGAQVADV